LRLLSSLAELTHARATLDDLRTISKRGQALPGIYFYNHIVDAPEAESKELDLNLIKPWIHQPWKPATASNAYS
jgi:hypothetical protein